MYEFLRGVLHAKTESQAVVEIAGIGYLVQVSANGSRDLPAPGEAVLVHVHTVHREDAFELFGFASEAERGVFRELLSLPGVGPRQALRFLSGMPLDDFVHAVAGGDVTALTRVTGLGKKNAEKIVLGLREKMAGFALGQPGRGSVAGGGAGPASLPVEAVAAMETLGYTAPAARAAVLAALSAGSDPADLEGLIRAALRHARNG
jgi:Holliday junction DNA helicase RuvA